jgi:repressor LexA
MENLTQRQQQVLDFISQCIDKYAPPILREISAHIGTRGTVTAFHHVEAIEKKLPAPEGKQRPGHCPYRKSRKIRALFSLPIVGTVGAGLSQLAAESIEVYCVISPEG